MPASEFRPPYQGLVPFEEDDAPYFFGRTRETRLIIANLFASPVTVVYGASGVGKSSVLRAGVISRLRERSDAVPILFSTWQEDPVLFLRGEVVREAGRRGIEIGADLSLAEAARALAGGSQCQVVFILDQFEELFLYHPATSPVLDDLADAINEGLLSPYDLGETPSPRGGLGRMSFILSLREDSLAKLDLFEGRIPDLLERVLGIGHLDREAGREAIEGPLEVYNREKPEGEPAVTIEPELIDAVLEQVSIGKIVLSEQRSSLATSAAGHEDLRIEAPFLQLVLTRLWDEEQRLGSARLRQSTFDALGGAETIVRFHLDKVMGKLGELDRDLAAQAFRYLVTPSGSKIAHTADDLARYLEIPREDLDPVLQDLSSGRERILRTVAPAPEQPSAVRYEIFHDRLGAAILDWLSRSTRDRIASPVAEISPEIRAIEDEDEEEDEIEAPEPPRTGTALCLSGGGYRAMLFHVGALWRMNEAGMLPQLDRICSVSASSIVAGMLGKVWRELDFDSKGVASRFEDAVVGSIRGLADQTIDIPSMVMGIITPKGASDRLASTFRKLLFRSATLQDLPECPEFMLIATNMKTGLVWHFSRDFMGQRLARVQSPRLRLASAVAASAAVPPVFSPVRLRLDAEDIDSVKGADPESLRTSVLLTDGSVSDRMALETAWSRYQTIYVSDGGGKSTIKGLPPTDWARQSIHVMGLIDNQLRSVRKRQLLSSFASGVRKGTYWGLLSDLKAYRLPDSLSCPLERTRELARLPSRFERLSSRIQERLINWGYAICDTALRRHVHPDLPPGKFPYRGGV